VVGAGAGTQPERRAPLRAETRGPARLVRSIHQSGDVGVEQARTLSECTISGSTSEGTRMGTVRDAHRLRRVLTGWDVLLAPAASNANRPVGFTT